MKNKLIKSDGYERLLGSIRKELSALETFVKITYWHIGRDICEYLLENKDRAGYADNFYVLLAQQLPLSEKTLKRTVQFYKTYPIRTHVSELTWTHYLHLITIKDGDERKQLQERAISRGWNAPELKRRIRALKEKERKTEPEEIPQLDFTRGRLHTYKLIESESALAVDLGFQMRQDFEGNGNAGDYIGAVSKNKISISEDSLFTYVARIEEIIDGDTIKAIINCDFKMKIRQTLRFRGIDCPEIDTPEGQRAKKFVEDRLKGLEFIIVKTYKDRSDKYDRYLADIFYLRGETDPQKAADTGNFLNQELLGAGLAKKV